MNASEASKCAACGKDGGGLKTCTACKLVKYCDVNCQKAHRLLHKKRCRQRVSEIFDEALFKETEKDDCPICFLPLPFHANAITYKSCCGNFICNGCVVAMVRETGGHDICPYCRSPPAITIEADVRNIKKRIDEGKADGFLVLGESYYGGTRGMPVDKQKALELWRRGGELGNANANYKVAVMYAQGTEVEKNEKTAKHHYELAAMGGNVPARGCLGAFELKARNYYRALKHFLLAARAGCEVSLDNVKDAFVDQMISKEEYEKALRDFQKSQDDMKSDAREKVVPFYD